MDAPPPRGAGAPGSAPGGAGPHLGPERWVEVRVAVSGDEASRVAEALGEIAPAGAAVEHGIRAGDGGAWVAEARPAGPARVRVWFPHPGGPDAAAEHEARARVAAALAPLDLDGSPEPETALVEAPDWAREWRRFYRPLRVGRLVICPPWESPPPGAGEVRVVIDPGRAFGTGHHESTRLCLRALDAQLDEGSAVVDVGTGSGILAVAAAALGAASVRALDIDPDAVRVARESARLNGVADRVVAAVGSPGDPWPGSEPVAAPADLVLANLSAPLIAELAPELAALLRPGGILIAAGYLGSGVPTVWEALHASRLRTLRIESEGEWRCHVARREERPG